MKQQKRLQPRKKPAQARSKETVEAIVIAAGLVLPEVGYDKASCNRIAERAGVAIGTLYQYFPNKDAIIVALMARHIDESITPFAAMLRAIAADPPPLRALVETMVQATLAFYQEQQALVHELFEVAPRPPAIHALRAEALRLVADELAVLLRAYGTQDEEALPAIAYVAVELTDLMVRQFVLHPPVGQSPETLAHQLERLLSGYLASTFPVSTKES